MTFDELAKKYLTDDLDTLVSKVEKDELLDTTNKESRLKLISDERFRRDLDAIGMGDLDLVKRNYDDIIKRVNSDYSSKVKELRDNKSTYDNVTHDRKLRELKNENSKTLNDLRTMKDTYDYLQQNPDQMQLKTLKKMFGADKLTNEQFILGTENIPGLYMRGMNDWSAAYDKYAKAMGFTPTQEGLDKFMQQYSKPYGKDGRSLMTKWVAGAEYARNKEADPVGTGVAEFLAPFTTRKLERGLETDGFDLGKDVAYNAAMFLPYGRITKMLGPTSRTGRIGTELVEQALVPGVEAGLEFITPREEGGYSPLAPLLGGTVLNIGASRLGRRWNRVGDMLDPYGEQIEQAAKRTADVAGLVKEKAARRQKPGIKSMANEYYGIPDPMDYGITPDEAKRMMRENFVPVDVKDLGMEMDQGYLKEKYPRKLLEQKINPETGKPVLNPLTGEPELALNPETGNISVMIPESKVLEDERTLGNVASYNKAIEDARTKFGEVDRTYEPYQIDDLIRSRSVGKGEGTFRREFSELEDKLRSMGDEDAANVLNNLRYRETDPDLIREKFAEYMKNRKKLTAADMIQGGVKGVFTNMGSQLGRNAARRGAEEAGAGIPMVIPGINKLIKEEDKDDPYKINWYGK